MTASEASGPPGSPDGDEGGAPSIVARVLDVLVYLPAGAVLSALEDGPETIARGRARVDRELRNARVVGRFVVDVGRRQLEEQIALFAGERRRVADHAGETSTERRRRAPASETRPVTSPPRDPEVDRAIPDYDILAASQVLRRLDGLGNAELRAVVRHERATRGRRTVLQRAEQLLGAHGTDGTTDGTDGTIDGTA